MVFMARRSGAKREKRGLVESARRAVGVGLRALWRGRLGHGLVAGLAQGHDRFGLGAVGAVWGGRLRAGQGGVGVASRWARMGARALMFQRWV